ncbi:immunoglobulin omega chain-like [Vanacampus margaritifer]
MRQRVSLVTQPSIMPPVVSLFVICLLCSVAGDGKGVRQMPDLLVRLGLPARMHCSHNLGGAFLLMFWYRKTPGGDLKHILSTSPFKSQPGFGDADPRHFWAEQAEDDRGFLTVSKVRPDDAGIYWCAVGTLHGDVRPCEGVPKK